ncbi:YdeI/OmpD-associated family protein [Bowmanella sp. Y26]|uniref:YdeI/OmpD-associated family protein n=1 Tax=Bowmanella yangjiangensis TaxID=2811230 RepID=UPI001BDBB913|nr:YdeI/OmpD-associated family protein [Bowmanella yangjiangensis]MBT1065185.1 YdeI/OmpD-associated family protein [Bowmanella yangjiangensis]
MTQDTKSQFHAELLRPKVAGNEEWSFIVLPLDVSEKLPRRGRTSIDGYINNHSFTAQLEPDGRKSHWLKVDLALMQAAAVSIGDEVEFEIQAVAEEPEPELPADFQQALNNVPEAQATWQATTTLARVDWLHWITTAKQAKTRAKRIQDACNMLASGKKRVCCFDPSGFYSKALSAPEVA